jgi:hypothetical protein
MPLAAVMQTAATELAILSRSLQEKVVLKPPMAWKRAAVRARVLAVQKYVWLGSAL